MSKADDVAVARRAAYYRWPCGHCREVGDGQPRPLDLVVDADCPECDQRGTARLEVDVDLTGDGLLWLVNRCVLHPRGYALAWTPDHVLQGAFRLVGDGGECWSFAAEDDDDGFQRVSALLERMDTAVYRPLAVPRGTPSGPAASDEASVAEVSRLRRRVAELEERLAAGYRPGPGEVLVRQVDDQTYWITGPDRQTMLNWSARLRQGIPASVGLLRDETVTR